MSENYPNLKKIFPDYKPLFTSSGTCAFYLALKSIANAQSGGGEVIIPSTICSSIPLAAMQAGFSIRFCDVEKENFCLSLEKIKPHINKNTKAILVPYLFGKSLPILDILNFARDQNIVVIEDIAQSIGSRTGKSYYGSFADLTILSFNEKKIIGKEDAGCLLFKNENDLLWTKNVERQLPLALPPSQLNKLQNEFRNLTMSFFSESRNSLFHVKTPNYSDIFQKYELAFLFRCHLADSTKQRLDQELSDIEAIRQDRFKKYQIYLENLSLKYRAVQFSANEMIWRLPLLSPSFATQQMIIKTLRNEGHLVSDHYFPMSVYFGQYGLLNAEEIGLTAVNLWVDQKVTPDMIYKSVKLLNSIVGD
jgi:dTDP-4-amino-4,6-dideoxygalactose transaminase